MHRIFVALVSLLLCSEVGAEAPKYPFNSGFLNRDGKKAMDNWFFVDGLAASRVAMSYSQNRDKTSKNHLRWYKFSLDYKDEKAELMSHQETLTLHLYVKQKLKEFHGKAKFDRLDEMASTTFHLTDEEADKFYKQPDFRKQIHSLEILSMIAAYDKKFGKKEAASNKNVP